MRKLKALIAGLTALCMCAVYMPLTESALSKVSMLSAHAESSGTCGDNLTWVLDDKGTLTISGTGDMWVVMYESGGSYIEWAESKENIQKVVIQEGVTSICPSAFKDCINLTSVTIPASVTNIGGNAFAGTPWLKAKQKESPLVIINHILIDGTACTGEITIPETVTAIGEYAFYSCKALTAVNLPENMTTICAGAFRNCDGLTSMTIPDSVASIGASAFAGCDNLASVKLPKGLQRLGYQLFSGCKSLASIDIPDSVTNIDYETFSDCSSLTSVVLPVSITAIQYDAFIGCYGLVSIEAPENTKYYSSENGILFDKDKTKLVRYPAGKPETEYTIPDGITEIYSLAFYGCINLTSVKIPDSVTKIGSSAFASTKLTSVTIPASVTKVEYDAFGYCSKLNSIIFKNPDCEIEGNNVVPSTAIIYGYKNSTAQAYAEKYNRTFVDIETIPQREKKFVDGADNWSFSNSRTNFGDTYFMQDSYYKKLLNGLNNIEKEKIYDAVRNTKWSGSCYGMATTSVLASNSLLNPADYQENANFLHDISAPPSDEVKSLINYYFMLQFTDNIQNQTRQAAYESEEEKLKKLISCLEDDSPALLTYFGYFNGSKFNYGGHGVVAYGVEYGTYSKDGKAYNGKILTYDNNAVDYDESYCLYFNTSDWSWVIPHYQLDSKKGSTLGFISDDVNLLNAHGYLNSGTYQNSASDYIAMLDADTMNGDYSIHKVNYSNGTWINAPTAEDDIKLFSSLSDTQETNNLCFALKDAESGYVMEMNSPTSMNLSMNYENVFLNSTASKGLNTCFSPEGCIFLEGKKTSYNMQIVLNENELVTDWYSFSISGGSADAVKLEKSKNGYILTSPNMKNIIAEAYNDGNDAFINFSTDADSVFLYEIDKNTIGVKVDSNNDGSYDKLIAQTPESIIGDANLDGTVDILDVITINKAILGKETLTRHQNEFSDVNQNGVPDSSDSLAVLKYIVGLTSSLK